jgi:hypothetical protein
MASSCALGESGKAGESCGRCSEERGVAQRGRRRRRRRRRVVEVAAAVVVVVVFAVVGR